MRESVRVREGYWHLEMWGEWALGEARRTMKEMWTRGKEF